MRQFLIARYRTSCLTCGQHIFPGDMMVCVGTWVHARCEHATKSPTFERELTSLLNSHGMERGSDTPDWVLAQFLTGCLKSFDAAVRARDSLTIDQDDWLTRVF